MFGKGLNFVGLRLLRLGRSVDNSGWSELKMGNNGFGVGGL